MSMYVYSHDSWYTVIYPDDKEKPKSFSKKNEKSALSFILILYSVKSGGVFLVLNECSLESSSVNQIDFHINSLLTKMRKVAGDCPHLPVISFSSQMTYFLSSVYFHLLSTFSFSLQFIYQEDRSFLLLVLKLFSWQY